MAPELWNQVRRAVDDADQPGQFFHTASAVPAGDASRHTGAGRFAFVRMRPMSLFETGASSCAVSLHHLFAGHGPVVADPGLNIHDLSALIDRPRRLAGSAGPIAISMVATIDLHWVGTSHTWHPSGLYHSIFSGTGQPHPCTLTRWIFSRFTPRGATAMRWS